MGAESAADGFGHEVAQAHARVCGKAGDGAARIGRVWSRADVSICGTDPFYLLLAALGYGPILDWTSVPDGSAIQLA